MTYWVVTHLHHLTATWDEVQALADWNRRRGHRVHVCGIGVCRYAVWPAN